jgi:Putative polyhydroxyalkanoic acid system protein (PHA_gran_rgn)
MGMIDFQVPHSLPLAEAKKRIEKLTQHWAKHGIQSSWSGDEAKLQGKVMGIHLDATLRVTDKTVGGQATDTSSRPGSTRRRRSRSSSGADSGALVAARAATTGRDGVSGGVLGCDRPVTQLPAARPSGGPSPAVALGSPADA